MNRDAAKVIFIFTFIFSFLLGVAVDDFNDWLNDKPVVEEKEKGAL